MDEETIIINANTRNEKIKSFLIKNRKLIILLSTFLAIIMISFYSYQIYENKQRKLIANKYNTALIEYKEKSKSEVILLLKEIIEDKDKTYSPLALYFLIDNNLEKNNKIVNKLFDTIINDTNIEIEIKNLIIYKKGLYNSNFATESELLEILGPIINSENIWKSHALYLMGEYFYSKNEKEKAKEFFTQILLSSNVNSDLKLEAQKRIKRDFSE